jgi:ATP adenylyltransferase
VEVLRSPWRLAYVASGVKPAGCVLCLALEAPAAESLVVHAGEHAFVVMNLYPYNAGHVMVTPRRHVGRLSDATASELGEIMALTQKCEGVLAEAYRFDGLNVGLNLGRSAGAGVEGHIHVHVVPRWNGDSNFVSVLGDTRVLPETLEDTWTRLRRRLGG